MTAPFKGIQPTEITDNIFKLIADDWMLITAGTIGSFNTMTANWGAFGELWHRKICICFVRPTRYTYKFMESADSFTLSFFEERHRSILDYCGSNSGRDVDKVKATGLKALESTTGSVYFAEARLVLDCRKIYSDDLSPQRFIEPSIEQEYPKKDYHRIYIGEIVACLMR